MATRHDGPARNRIAETARPLYRGWKENPAAPLGFRGLARARNLLFLPMSPNVSIAVYTLLGFAVVLLIFLGALAFVNAARKGNRQFKWASRPARLRDHL